MPPHKQGRHYAAYERYMADQVSARGGVPAFGLIKKGEALIWAANLLHGGSKQKDKGRSRRSQVTHYFSEGGRYFTPLHSHGSYICYRRPRWIPAVSPA